jgi:sortase A
MIIAGLGMLAWAGLVYAWQGPFTAIANKRAQRALGQQFEHRVEAYRASPQVEAPRPASLPRLAARFRGGVKLGDAVGRLTIPRLGLRVFVVYGTDTASLKRGPAIDPRTTLPGAGELVYIAGHRTTYGAPFSDIDKLRRGDNVTLQLPYATFTYRVTSRRIVPATFLQALDSRGREEIALQACWPRFFASHRIIVYAKPIAAGVPRRSATAEATTRSARGLDVTMAMLASTVGLSVPGEWSLSAGIAIA